MKLTQLLERLDYTCLQGTMDREIGRVVADSRQAREDALFL